MTADARKIAGWVLVGILLFFILINLEDVQINFFWVMKLRMPVAFALFLAAALGAGAVFTFQFIRKFKKDPPDPPK